MRSPASLLRRPRDDAHSPHARRFALGDRSTADLIAPAAIEETRAQLAIDGQLTRVLALTDYPRHVSPNWLGRLIDFEDPLDLSLHLEPLDSKEVVRMLTHRMVELQSSRMLDAKGGRIASVEREVAYEDVERLRDALERGDERVFSTSLYLRVHGRTANELDQATARVEGTLGGMMAGARPALYEMLPGLLSCLPAGQDHLGRRRNLDTSSVATMIPFTSSHLAVERGLLYGVNVHNRSLVIFDPFGADQENANKVVFAKSGAGKSYACKVEALRALLLGVEYYVIDPEDEYARLCEAVGGQMIRLSGTSPHRINPFDLPQMARENPDDFDSLTGPHSVTESTWVNAALLTAWSANPERYADHTVEFLIEDPAARLDIGYSVSMGGVDTLAAISRTAIAAASPLCSDVLFQALEASILNFTPDWERTARLVGRTQLALLRALAPARISSRAHRRLQELERRFPDAPERGAPEPPRDDERLSGWVGSPIPATSQALMSEDQWVAAMREHTSDWSDFKNGRTVGGAVELSRGLESIISASPDRAVSLARKMSADLNPIYFEAILRGLAPMSNGKTLVGSAEQVWSVIRRIRELDIGAGGHEVARAVMATAEEEVPEDILEALRLVAAADPDPQADDWLDGEGHRDALSQAINSARGAAAEALAQLLFADRTRWPALADVVERVATDHVLAVRVTAVNCLLAVLDTNREEALTMFASMMEGAEAILDSHYVERFVSFTIFRDYGAVRDLLVRALSATRPGTVQAAARRITLAALWIDEAGKDADLVLAADDSARAGAAEVFAANIAHTDVANLSEMHLRSLFHDRSAEVRKAASRCWLELSPDEVAARGQLIRAYGESPAFADGDHLLFHHLADAQRPLPPELCDVAARAVEVWGPRASSIQFAEAGEAGDLSKLMIRLYDETSDPSLRARILDNIDAMMRAGFYGIGDRVSERFDR